MKTKTFFLCLLAFCLTALSGRASGLGDFRINARFLTDRMAFELHLSTDQYNDLYEINYDFLNNVGPYLSGIAIADSRALDAYYRYLDERNDDLRWVLSNAEYVRFMGIEYFFRPIYALNSVCYLRIYQVYPNRNYFYFGPPRHYLTYRGGHCRAHFGGASFYRRNYPIRYRHPVYSRPCHISPQLRPKDFARPKPGNRPPKDNHWTPAPRPGHQPVANGRPEYRPVQKPNNRPQARPEARPQRRPENQPQRRPEAAPQRRPGTRPQAKPNKGTTVKPGQSRSRQNQKKEADHDRKSLSKRL